ncbi:nitrogen regulation protein NR(II), partial [Candidatus Sumerlaeota bacterium]
VEANRRFTETYGPWQDRLCHELYKGRSSRCERCAAAKTFGDGQVRVREEEGLTRESCPTHYLVHMIPLVRDDGQIPYVIELSTDITHVKQLEQDKLAAERLAAVGQTVAGLAHGIKNIITGLEGGMYVVGSGLKRNDSERMAQGWEMLEENIARISAFVKEFLEFARGRQANVQLIAPNDVVGKVIGLYHDGAALAGVTLEAELADELAAAPLDEEGLHVCLANLVSNALDACDMSDGEEKRVWVRTREQEGALIYEVADNGCGMDYDVKQKVFTNFFSTKDTGKGTGLGLLTTRKIVQEHGGTVSFESTEGEGSVFRLEFPRDRLPKISQGVDEE